MRGSACLSLLLAASCAPADAPGFDAPVAALHDAIADVYLVSNGPATRGGDGYLARVRPGGSMERHWLQGGGNGVVLHAPQGLALDGETLWVADGAVLRKFDRGSGRPLGAVELPGAKELRGLAVAADHAVHAADFGGSAIWVVPKDGPPRCLAKGEELGQPTALVCTSGGVYGVSWSGAFFEIDHEGRRTELLQAPTAQLDGLLRLPDGRWLCSSRAGRCLYVFDRQGGVRERITDLDGPGGLGYDAGRSRLLLPLRDRNELLVRGAQ